MKTRLTSVALTLAAMLAGCAGMMHREGPMAMAKLEATRGNATTGTVMFHQHGDHLMVHAKVEGLKPGQEHGFHIHEKGDCSSGDGMSTGGHFNPAGQPHGRHGAGMHHVGDLPSLKADGAGVARIDFTSTAIRLGGGGNDIVGRGLIVHRDPDDYTTQPTGNAGPRLACAVIVPF